MNNTDSEKFPVQQEINPEVFLREMSGTVSDMVAEVKEDGYWDEDNYHYIAEKVINLLYADNKAFYEWKENL